MKKILGAIRRADFDFNLINNGDVIGVGLSGGKDSTMLLHALHLYRFYSKKDFEIKGIHLKMGFPDMNIEPLIEFCQTNNYFLHLEETKIYHILKLHLVNEKISCSRCSTLKKGAVVKVAKMLNCNKVAFGHHADDAIETLFLNMIYGGKLQTFSPSMYLSNENIEFVRPFAYVSEQMIIKSMNKINLPVIESTCPNNKHTKREEIKIMLKEIYQKFPEAKTNFENSLTTEEVKIWSKNKK